MKKSDQGFTLIELLISITIALIITAAIFGIYANSAGTSAAMLKSSKLNQELYSLMLVMSNDIRRAGYVAAPDPIVDSENFDTFLENPQGNPFSQDDTELALIDSYTSNTAITGNSPGEAQCVLYTFDQDGDGTLDKEEIFGFRLNSNDGTVEMRVGWDDYDPATSVINQLCDKGNWDAVTDKNLIKITDLSFNRSDSECTYANFPDEPNAKDDDMNGVVDDEPTDCYTTDASQYVKDVLQPDATEPRYSDFVTSIMTVETRQIRIELQGELVNDPAVRARIEQDVRVRNDKVREWKI
jgi:type IV pilus assembly protein PilW